MKLDVDGYLNHQWEQHCRQNEEAELAELAFDQFEFDTKIKLTVENYDLVRQVFIEGFKKGRTT